MEARIQYAMTGGGVSIAYTTFGKGGVPLVVLRVPYLSHLGLEMDLPFERNGHEFERLSERRLVVRLDPRNGGLSDRGVADISMEARLQDVLAVVDRLELESFAVQAHLAMVPLAITLAARFPERVSHLILSQPYARGEDYWNVPRRKGLDMLSQSSWEIYTETTMSAAMSWAPGELPRALAAHMRASMTQADYLAFIRAEQKVDVTPLLSDVRAPALVCHYPRFEVSSREIASQLACKLADGRLALLDSMDSTIQAFNEFLGEAAEVTGGGG